MRHAYLLGVAIGSIITAILVYLPLSGLFDKNVLASLFPGLLGVLFFSSLEIPGASVAGVLARGGLRGALAGAITGIIGYLVLLFPVIRDYSGPTHSMPLPIGLFISYALGLIAFALVVGGIAGYLRE